MNYFLFYTVIVSVTIISSESAKNGYYKSCQDIKERTKSKPNGIYQIVPDHSTSIIRVFCDDEWIVLQRRTSEYQPFQKYWLDYKFGFGNLMKDFWLGNENIHILTATKNSVVRFDLWDNHNEHKYAEYSLFRVDSEVQNYRLTIAGYHGNAGDAMNYHNGRYFSTRDRDNDLYSSSCSNKHGGNGGWWYNRCIYSNLNGEYQRPGMPASNGIIWNRWRGYVSLKKTLMRIKYN